MAQLIRPIRQLSPQCNRHFRNLRHLLLKKHSTPPASSIPTLLLFPSFSTARSPPRRPKPPEALTPTVIAEGDVDSDGSESESLRSRNQRKRDARRAVKWGMELASFSPDQIKRILKAASLGEEVYDALKLAKARMFEKEGVGRHFNYIGKLLREVETDLMDTLIDATKQGDHTMLQALISAAKDDANDNNDDDIETESEDEEGSDEYMAIATRWFDGLISQNVEVTNEVYSLRSVDFDRQELRKLVRKVQLAHEQRNDIIEEKQKKPMQQ